MRDRQAIYATRKPSQVKATWGFLAAFHAISLGGIFYVFPTNRPLGGAVLVASFLTGAAFALLLPPKESSKKSPDPWAAAGIGLFFTSSGLATRTVVFALGCAMVALLIYMTLFNVNTFRYHRKHGVVEPVDEPQESLTTQELLHSVVDDVISADVHTEFTSLTEFKHRVYLTLGGRTAVLEAAGEWLELRLPDLGASRLEDDPEALGKRATLRSLALVANAYLAGDGQVERRFAVWRDREVYAVALGNRRYEVGPKNSLLWDV